jgi:UDPglucose 6-dehydrogenase
MSRILIVGAGVVGKATGVGLIEHDHDVTFVDVSTGTVEALQQEGRTAILPGQIDLNGVDAVFVSVTALTSENDGIDLTHLYAATQTLGEKLRECRGAPVIVYRCTLPPGTVRGDLTVRLEQASGKQAGVDFGVVYNPEFLRAETALADFCDPRVVVLASAESTEWARDKIATILGDFGAPIHTPSLEAAELLKYVNNVFNYVKIVFFNAMRQLGVKLGVEHVDEAFELATMSAEGLWNPLYGTRDKGPADGVCLPKDTAALLHMAKLLGFDEFERVLAGLQDLNRLEGGAR